MGMVFYAEVRGPYWVKVEWNGSAYELEVACNTPFGREVEYSEEHDSKENAVESALSFLEKYWKEMER